jgi:hypothetical protein
MQGSKFEIIYLSKVKTCFDDSNTARNFEDNSIEQTKYQLYFYYFGIYKCHSMLHDSSIYILPNAAICFIYIYKCNCKSGQIKYPYTLKGGNVLFKYWTFVM